METQSRLHPGNYTGFTCMTCNRMDIRNTRTRMTTAVLEFRAFYSVSILATNPIYELAFALSSSWDGSAMTEPFQFPTMFPFIVSSQCNKQTICLQTTQYICPTVSAINGKNCYHNRHTVAECFTNKNTHIWGFMLQLDRVVLGLCHKLFSFQLLFWKWRDDFPCF